MADEERDDRIPENDDVLAYFTRPDGRIDATYYHADRRAENLIAPNAINNVRDLAILLNDLYVHLQQPEEKTPVEVGQLMIRIRNAHEWLKYIGPGGDFMRGLADTIRGVVDYNLNPGANPPTKKEVELWELERADLNGEFGPPDEHEPRG